MTAIETVYRDTSPAAPALNIDADARVSPRAAADALDACREAREAFLINEKGIVRLQYCCMTLPAPSGACLSPQNRRGD